jgi:hypothetical protein
MLESVSGLMPDPWKSILVAMKAVVVLVSLELWEQACSQCFHIDLVLLVAYSIFHVAMAQRMLMSRGEGAT